MHLAFSSTAAEFTQFKLVAHPAAGVGEDEVGGSAVECDGGLAPIGWEGVCRTGLNEDGLDGEDGGERGRAGLSRLGGGGLVELGGPGGLGGLGGGGLGGLGGSAKTPMLLEELSAT